MRRNKPWFIRLAEKKNPFKRLITTNTAMAEGKWALSNTASGGPEMQTISPGAGDNLSLSG